MVRRLLTSVVRSPVLYDAVQWVFGNPGVLRRLEPHLAAIRRGAWMVDIGGGTGLSFTTGVRYVCVDLEPEKLRRFRQLNPAGMAIVGDATRCPLRSGSVDAVLCAKMTHHLDDAELAAAYAECGRILKPGGTLIVVDALRTDRWIARLLWGIDRGAHPRSEDEMEAAIPSTFSITNTDRFRIGVLNDFVIYRLSLT